MAINLHHLRLFSAVVDHGGFTRAAAELNLSQPAISKSLAELERQLHVRLIDRSGRAASLTDAGRTLHARAKEIFGVERLAEQELREFRGLKRGQTARRRDADYRDISAAGDSRPIPSASSSSSAST